MKSYRFARRAFMQGIGGALGLRTILSTMEASALGATSPPRLLMCHWPVGTVKYNFVPEGSGKSFTFSRILKPFETAGLKDDMIILYGLDNNSIGGPGGGHEKGTPIMTTGMATPGTRDGEPETDDAFAGGPSFDQIFLKNVPALARPGKGYVNTICDSRVDLLEVSTQCLSYGYSTQPVAAVGGKMIPENTPLLPELSPLQVYLSLFSSFAPDPTGANADQVKRALKQRKSVLDFALRELAQLKTLGPASERDKIDIHAEAIRKVETDLSNQLNGTGPAAAACVAPSKPDASVIGQADGRKQRRDYDNFATTSSDDVTHEAVGKLHMSIIRAAFQCDIVRVASFQWSPGTNHVAFKGMYPGEPNSIYMHHPLSHRITNRNYSLDASTVPSTGPAKGDIEFLTQVQTWYNSKMADILGQFKTAKDSYGGSLLDNTVIPYMTEVAETTHSRGPLPAMIFGGKALGMQTGQYINLETAKRPHNDLWLTIAQAYFPNSSDVLQDLKNELFVGAKNTYTGPNSGLWAKPT
jgi:hypothetical protein